MDLNVILNEITSGLTGEYDVDIHYLKEQMEKYKNHELSKEILRACGRITYDLLPEDKKKELKRVIDEDSKVTKTAIKKIRFNMFEGNIEKAFKLSEALVNKVDGVPIFDNDSASEYYSFDTTFEEILYEYYNRPQRTIRSAAIPYSEIYYIHGNLLFELKRIPEAQVYLEKSLRWNPASCPVAFEYIETFKAERKLDKFFELTKAQFKYAYKPEYMARCYRNLGFYFIEEEEYSVAVGCFLMSLIYEPDNKLAPSELYYIQSTAPEKYHEPTSEQLNQYAQEYGFPIGAPEAIIGLAHEYSKKALDDNKIDWAIYFLEIFCGLTEDETASQLLEQLKQQGASSEE